MPIQVTGFFTPQFEKERQTVDRVGFMQTVWVKRVRTEEFLSGPIPPQLWREDIRFTREEVELVDGVAVIRHFYDGLPSGATDPSGRAGINTLYEFDPSFDEVPIQAHHNFGGPDGSDDSLFKKYGGYYDGNGNLRWRPAESKSGKSSSRGLAPLGSPAQSVGGPGAVKSLQGVESYLRMGGVFRIVYAHRGEAMPSNLFFGVGTIQTPPSSNVLPTLPSSRNWLKGPPSARWRGNAWEITEEYILSGVGGWIKDIYDGRTESQAGQST
jgi:hypothetical protein